jgi:hypothetical protein
MRFKRFLREAKAVADWEPGRSGKLFPRIARMRYAERKQWEEFSVAEIVAEDVGVTYDGGKPTRTSRR